MKDRELLKPNVILVDADYLDKLAFNFIVNFERMLNRKIPNADLCNWLDCIALDGGLRPETKNETTVVFLHSKDKRRLDYFIPADFENELDGQAFKDNLGEFLLKSVADEGMATYDRFFEDVLRATLAEPQVERLMVIGDNEKQGNSIVRIVQEADKKDTTIFSMQPLMGHGFSQEVLGYSLMNSLGIKSDELG